MCPADVPLEPPKDGAPPQLGRDDPPPGPPWDVALADAPLVFVDLEMTGLDPKADRVVEVCAERWVGGALVAHVTSLVLPPERVGGAAHVHGLDASALAGAPTFAEIAPALLEVLDGGVFIAHSARWDADFLRAEFARVGVELPLLHYLDTLVLARRAFSLPRYSLGGLAAHFGIDPGKAHRAADDVRTMRELFAKCIDALGPASVRDLWEVRVGERKARAAILQACERAIEYAESVSIVYRPSHRPQETFGFVVVAVQAEAEPPRVTGYQLPGRGRRELRADRILRVDPIPRAP